jgi:hypothetical protein
MTSRRTVSCEAGAFCGTHLPSGLGATGPFWAICCPASLAEVPARTPESDALSKDLGRRGFTFVGSTICYAFMQSAGMVNDHVQGCFRAAAA